MDPSILIWELGTISPTLMDLITHGLICISKILVKWQKVTVIKIEFWEEKLLFGVKSAISTLITKKFGSGLVL
jgi:hypothetical protein